MDVDEAAMKRTVPAGSATCRDLDLKCENTGWDGFGEMFI